MQSFRRAWIMAAGGIIAFAVAYPIYGGGEEDIWGLTLRGDRAVFRRDENDEVRRAFGWPRRLPADVPLWGRSPALLDLDRNGDMEIGVVSGDGRLAVFQHDGANYPGFPLAQHRGDRPEAWVDVTRQVPATVSDINRDDWSELAYIADIGYMHVVTVQHNEPQPFPLDVGRDARFSPPVAADLSGDMRSELIFASAGGRPDADGGPALLHIITAAGDELAGWPVRYGYFSNSCPSVGDIDGDGGVEIIIGSSRQGDSLAHIWAFQRDATRKNGFPAGSFETIGGSPTLADVNNDGRLDILFYAREANGGRQGIFALDRTGQLIDGFPLETSGGHPTGSPVVGGSGVNGELQISFGTMDREKGAAIELFNLDGSRVDGFPLHVGSPAVVGSLMMADVTGDGRCEIIASMAPPAGGSGWIGAWTSNGQPAAGFPLSLNDYGGGAFASSPTLWDANGDVYTDIICPTTDGWLYIWETPGLFTGDIWPTEKGSFTRMGVKPPRRDLSVKREPYAAPAGSFIINLAPNPFNGAAVVSFEALRGAAVKISLFDLQGRECERLFEGIGQGGSVSIRLNAAGRLTPGLYMICWRSEDKSGAMKVVYLP